MYIDGVDMMLDDAMYENSINQAFQAGYRQAILGKAFRLTEYQQSIIACYEDYYVDGCIYGLGMKGIKRFMTELFHYIIHGGRLI